MEIDAKYSPGTFRFDHVLRDDKGVPVGRAVMLEDDAYAEGKDIPIVILKIPLQFRDKILGSFVFVDGFRYKLPESLPEFRINKRENDWVASSFILRRA
jgi:hypothetical protein